MSSPSKNLKRCVVPYCMTVATKGFASFPTNLHEKHMWQRLCGLPYVRPRALVCHSHFTDSCFVDANRERRKLLKNSRPSLRLPNVFQAPTQDVHGVEVLDQARDDLQARNVVIQEGIGPMAPMELDHDYRDNSSYWELAFKALNRECSHQKITILRLEKTIRILKLQLTAYKAERFPKSLVKKVCHKALIGPGKFLSVAQVNWMIETTPDNPRCRAVFGDIEKCKVCYFTRVSLLHNPHAWFSTFSLE